ncbi:hypothetical protein CEXT_686241, partial [Caerostris extrusa]
RGFQIIGVRTSSTRMSLHPSSKICNDITRSPRYVFVNINRPSITQGASGRLWQSNQCTLP